MIEIFDINSPELNIYTSYNENQLLHYYEPDLGVFIAESPNVIMRALEAGYEPLSFLIEKGCKEDIFLEKISEYDVPCYMAEEAELKKITGYPMTRGSLCAFRRKQMLGIDEIIADAKRVVILEDVMNPTNLGAIFRSAAALNMDAVILTAGSSDPLYRRSARVSMGTVFQIPWTIMDKKFSWPKGGMEYFKEKGFKTVAMALRNDSVDIDNHELMKEEKLAIIMGTEAFGLSDYTIDNSDYTVKIPMSHGVDSLNVAAASAIAFWQLGKQV